MYITKDDFRPNRASQSAAIEKAYLKYNVYSNKVKNAEYMVVINFKEPSYKKRLYVVNINTLKVLREHHVAHGVKSNCLFDAAKACYFSNKYGSRKSSRGAMVTGNTYTWGKRFPTRTKLKLRGLERGINDNVFIRAIVMHSSNYVTDPYILRNRRAGNSWGCPAIDPAIADSLIELIKGGTFVYIHA